ncbi:iron-containing alcohol dehydrogenase [bacterium]|nr:iron-containing alcohol dehydrogenase [bacterium]
MENFNLNIPTKYYFGKGAFKKAGKLVKGMGKRVMIVIGKGSVKKNGYLKELENQLKNINVEYVIFEGIEPNPRVKTIDRANEMARKAKVKYLIALGGGSVIDAAKGIAMSHFGNDTIWNYAFLGDISKMKIPEKTLPIIAIPTLSATGSEMDSGAVITNWELHKKVAIFNAMLFPRIAIVDPTLTYSVNKEQTAYGSVDIITHISESYFTATEGSSIQDGFTETLFKTVMKYTSIAQMDPSNYEARSNIAYASSLALCGIINNGRGRKFTMHGIEHTLSAFLDIPHGLGLAMIMPSYLRYIYKHNIDRFYNFATKIMEIPAGNDKEKIILKGIEKYESWQEEIGITQTLKDFQVSDEDLRKFAHETIKTRNPKGNTIESIIPLNEDDLFAILKKS